MRKASRLQEIIGKSSVNTKPQETVDRFSDATAKPTLVEHLFNGQAATPPIASIWLIHKCQSNPHNQPSHVSHAICVIINFIFRWMYTFIYNK